jgi:hypothetical protein
MPARRSLPAVALLPLLLAAPAARAADTVYAGPALADVDTVSASVATLFATVAGPVEHVAVSVETSARYADNLVIQLVHAGVAVTLYDGAGGNTLGAQIDARFDDDAGAPYPTPGPVVGAFAPSPGSLAAFAGREAAGAWELRIRNAYGPAGDGTDLLAWRLELHTGLAGPPVAVAVYDDGAYVDVVDDAPAEAEATNVKASLGALGHDVSSFQGTGAAAWSAGLAGRAVLVVPEVEAGDLAAALDESAEGVLAAFVAGGGTLVKVGAQQDDLDFLNEVFGYTLNSGGVAAPFVPRAGAIGTRFQQGPGSLPGDDSTSGVLGLPLGARSAYEPFGGGYAVVAWLPFASGTVIVLGWDWYDTAPRGTQDGGWLEVLDRAVLGEARSLSTRTVALYYDDGYVDLVDDGLSNEADEEALNVEAALDSLGHLPARFFGTDLLSFQQAFEAAPVVAIPELEQGDLASALPAEVEQALAEHVAAGGVLIVHGDGFDRSPSLLNEVFGFATASMGPLGTGQLALEPTAQGTRFDAGIPNLPRHEATHALTELPAGARPIYETPEDAAAVVWIPYGAGKVIYLGWEWYDAAPRGPLDEGWRFVLDRAVLEAPLPVPEPGPLRRALAAGLALAVLAGARARPARPRGARR